MNGEKAVKVGWAGGGWRNVDVVDLERGVIEGYGYREVFDGVVLWEEVVGGEVLERDGVVYEGEEAAATRRTWAVSADGAIICKIRDI